MVTLATKPNSFDLFTKEPELTDAVFAAFNKHSKTLFALKDKCAANIPEDERMPDMVARKERYSRSSTEEYVDPSNMIVDFMAFYKDTDLNYTDKLELEPLKNELTQAIANENKRHPASWSVNPSRDNMMSLLKSNPVVSELFNEKEIKR